MQMKLGSGQAEAVPRFQRPLHDGVDEIVGGFIWRRMAGGERASKTAKPGAHEVKSSCKATFALLSRRRRFFIVRAGPLSTLDYWTLASSAIAHGLYVFVFHEKAATFEKRNPCPPPPFAANKNSA